MRQMEKALEYNTTKDNKVKLSLFLLVLLWLHMIVVLCFRADISLGMCMPVNVSV